MNTPKPSPNPKPAGSFKPGRLSAEEIASLKQDLLETRQHNLEAFGKPEFLEYMKRVGAR